MTRLHSLRRAALSRLDEDAFARFLDDDDGLPVVIFNLLRFEADSGPDRFGKALARMHPELARFGAEVVFVGDAPAALWEDGGGPWDAVAIVRYPSRRAFADMVETSESYETPNTLRDASRLEVVLQPVRVIN